MKLLIITQKVDENDQLLGFFIDWIHRFSEKFGKIVIICLEKGEFKLPENVEVISLGKDSRVGKLKILFKFYLLIFTRRNDYDAVFVHMNPIWVVLGGPYWRLRGKNVFFWYTHKAVTLKLRLAEKFANTIFTASKESFRLKSKKIIITGHGIDTRLFQPGEKLTLASSSGREEIKNEKLKILSVGRIAPVKNYETLIKAANILKNRGENFSVTMIGEAPLEQDKQYEEKLKLLITNYQLQDYFNFVGKVNHKDLPGYYQSHDIFIHLSKTGSLDKTILEAMACGMKVLSSNDASRGFLSPEMIFDQDNSAELADKIKSVIKKYSDPALREYVIQNHNLDNLLNRISVIINDN